MKKLFMEPEVKVTKFEYEDIMFNSGNVNVDGTPDVDDTEVPFE